VPARADVRFRRCDRRRLRRYNLGNALFSSYFISTGAPSDLQHALQVMVVVAIMVVVLLLLLLLLMLAVVVVVMVVVVAQFCSGVRQSAAAVRVRCERCPAVQ
jgi:hypothetical protein